MGAEAPLTGDSQAAAAVHMGEVRLGDAGLAGVTAPFHRAAETAQPIGVDRRQVEQRCPQPMPEGPRDHALLAMAGGKGHLLAGLGRTAIGHGEAVARLSPQDSGVWRVLPVSGAAAGAIMPAYRADQQWFDKRFVSPADSPLRSANLLRAIPHL
jgi:hypothetical protein